MISALALMLALSSPLGFWMETRTSKVVTLSFSTPRGEIFVTLPSNFLSLNDSTTIRAGWPRSEEHTSELQSRLHLVCRLVLEKKESLPSGRAVRRAAAG